MKKVLIAIAGAAMLLTGAVQAQSYQEGVHYEILDMEKTENPEIVEYFSFYCAACYHYEPIAEQIKLDHPDVFKKNHVNFVSPGRGMAEYVTQAYAAALALDKEEAITQSIYHSNFVLNRTLTSEDAVRNLFIANDVSGEEFDKVMNSFTVRSQASKMASNVKKFNVRSTPTFIVNGKYQMIPQGFRDSTDFVTDFSELATYLLEK